MTREVTELLPCPFCGGKPDIRTRMDEDLWTHNIVEWTGVSCSECSVGFEWPPGAEPSAIEQWNKRAPDRGNSPTIPIYRTSEAPNDNSKAVGDFTRVLKDQGMLDATGHVKRDV